MSKIKKRKRIVGLALLSCVVIYTSLAFTAGAAELTLTQQTQNLETQVNADDVESLRLVNLGNLVHATTPTITASDSTAVYDGNKHNIPVTVTGLPDDTEDGTPVAQGGVLHQIPYVVEYKDNAIGTWSAFPAGGISTMGSYTVRVTTTDPDYLVGTKSVQLNITKKPLTLTAVAQNKVYDGTKTSTVVYTLGTAGIIGAEDVSITNPTAQFSQSEVGNGVTVTLDAAVELTGANASSYQITQPTGLTANITKSTLTVDKAKVTIQDKEYDKTTNLIVDLGTGVLQGIVAGDDVTPVVTAVLDSDDVTNNGSATVTVTLNGADATNYELSEVTYNVSGIKVTKKELLVTSITVKDKEYDGTTEAEINTADLSGVIAGDDVVIAFPADSVFDNKEVSATAKDVTLGAFNVTGADIGNYNLVQPVNVYTASISKKTVNVVGASAQSKVYDGTTDVVLEFTSLNGAVNGDDVTPIITGSFDSANAGTGSNVTTTTSLDGADAGNYNVMQVGSLQADIDKRALIVDKAKVLVAPKAYDKTTTVVLVVAADAMLHIVSGDDVQYVMTGLLDTEDVTATGTVTVSIALSGTSLANYVLAETEYTMSNITVSKKELTVAGITVKDKEYDGTTVAEVESANLVGIIAGDTVDITLPTDSQFDTSSVDANPNAIVLGDFAISGVDSGNYTLKQPVSSVTATITKKAIAVNGAVAKDKVYDGTTLAAVEYVDLTGMFLGDDVTADIVGNFTSKNAGDNLSVATSVVLKGTKAGNYTVADVGNLNASIAKKTLQVVSKETDKFYGIIDNELTIVYTGLVSGDTISTIPGFVVPTIGIKDGVDTTRVNDYDIVTSGGDGGSNYILDYTPGIMHVVPEDNTAKVTVVGTGIIDTHVTVTVDGKNTKTILTDNLGSLDVYIPNDDGKEHVILVTDGVTTYTGKVTGTGTIDVSLITLEQDISKGSVEYVDGKTKQATVSTEIIHSGEFKLVQDEAVSVTANNIVASNGEIWLTLEDLNIDTSSANCPAMWVKSGAIVHLTLIGNNTFKSADGFAGLQVDKGGKLFIEGPGQLTAIGGKGAAGIGGADGKPCGHIEIISGTIIAIGGEGAYDIGNGANCTEDGDAIIIHDGAVVKADKVYPDPVNQDGVLLKHIVVDLSKYKDADLDVSLDNSTFKNITNGTGIFDLWIDKTATKLWVKIDEVLHYFDIDGTTLSELKKYVIPVTTGDAVTGGSGSSTPTETVEEKLPFNLDGVVAKTNEPTVLTNWVTSTGVIEADKGYLLADVVGYSNNTWVNELELDKNAIYEEYSFYTKNLNTGKIMSFVIKNALVDYTSPITTFKCSVKGLDRNFMIKDVYKVITKKNITFTVDANFGLSGRKAIQYQIVAKGKKFNKSGKWVTVKKNEVKMSKEFKGVIYFKFTDNVGNSMTDKTYGFTIDKTAPTLTNFKSTPTGVKLMPVSNKVKYTASVKNKISFILTPSFGLSGKGSIKYKLGDSGKWVTARSTKLTVAKNYKGTLYIKLTDKAGNSKTYRTSGFTVKK